MPHTLELPKDDLFDGLASYIDTALAVPNYRTRTAALSICQASRGSLDGGRLVAGLFERLDANWHRALARQPRGSTQNFRWHMPQLNISSQNTSAEVSLERALVSALNQLGRLDWSNQVPLVSGIMGGGAGKRRAVDLVRRRADDSFEFVELKIATDTPVYAGLEVLQYGLLWALSRRDKDRLGYVGRTMIETSTLQLTVLAPRSFYSGYSLEQFVSALDDGARALGRQFGLHMAFAMAAFRQDFIWPLPYTCEQLVAHLDAVEPV